MSAWWASSSPNPSLELGRGLWERGRSRRQRTVDYPQDAPDSSKRSFVRGRRLDVLGAHRFGNDLDGVAHVVEGEHRVEIHHHHVGKSELVRLSQRNPRLKQPNCIVGDVADQPTGKTRRSVDPDPTGTLQTARDPSHRIGRIAETPRQHPARANSQKRPSGLMLSPLDRLKQETVLLAMRQLEEG